MQMLKDILANKKLFIFDMDGTITDTEPLHFLSYQRTLSELFPGFVLTEEEFLSCYVGHPETEIYMLLQKAHGIVFAADIFFQKRMGHLFCLVRETHLVTAPFYRQLCRLFPDKEKIMLTSQRTQVLDRFQKEVDFGGYLSRYISVAGEPGGKAARLREPVTYFGYMPQDIAIFEDYAPTLSCARENGIYAVGVCHRFNRLPQDCCDAQIKIDREIES